MMNETFIKEYKIDDKTICDNLINYFKENNQYKLPGRTDDKVSSNSKKSTDLYVYNESQDLRVKNYLNNISKFLLEYLNHYELDAVALTKEPFNIQHYKPGEGFYSWHCERWNNHNLKTQRAFVFMTYLNDVKNGGTEFKYQKKKFQAKKGLTLIWPTDFTHTHRGIISKTQEKYIATGWFHFATKDEIGHLI